LSVALYMDVHVPASITRALLARGVDVVTAQADGTTRLHDSELLERARELKRIMFSRDADFVSEATARQRRNEPFAGLIYAHQLRVTIGRCVQDLELIAQCSEPDGFLNPIEHLPLR
jgi:predicted nuclease of predicted toxin-antitoxin system